MNGDSFADTLPSQAYVLDSAMEFCGVGMFAYHPNASVLMDWRVCVSEDFDDLIASVWVICQQSRYERYAVYGL